MGKHFNLKRSNNKSVDSYYEEQYKNWRKKQENGGKFFILYKEFEESYLKQISPGALKLYIYYGFKSKNETGLSWYGVSSAALDLNVSERTINKWNSELEEMGLIKRTTSINKSSKQTWLLPFSTNFIQINSSIEEYLKEAEKKNFIEVYGSVDRIYHVFQWRSNKNNSEDKKKEDLKNIKYDNPFHALIIVTKKVYNRDDYRLTLHQYEIKTYNDRSYKYAVGKANSLFDDLYIFNSNYNIDGFDIKGIAVGGKKDINNKFILCDLIEELYQEGVDIESLQKLEISEYGKEKEHTAEESTPKEGGTV